MYRHVVVAGTFDRLHVGHERILSKAFEVGEHVVIGLTSDSYVQRFKGKRQKAKGKSASQNSKSLIPNTKTQILPYEMRKKNLLDWLTSNGYTDRVTVIPLDDPYGFVVPQSAHDAIQPDVEAIVVSSDTRARAEEINRLRQEAGWKPLDMIEVPMVAAEDLQAISSTRVRNGDIDREGRLMMPDNLRPELQKPLGTVIPDTGRGSAFDFRLRGNDKELGGNDKRYIITVGDVATKTLLDTGYIPSLSIIDAKVERKDYTKAQKELARLNIPVVTVQSGPGYISKEAIRVIRETLIHRSASSAGEYIDTRPPHVILIDGEEDLLALPVIAEAPIGSVVYYGQPRIASVRGKPAEGGLVEVVVTKEKKKKAVALLARFV